MAVLRFLFTSTPVRVHNCNTVAIWKQAQSQVIVSTMQWYKNNHSVLCVGYIKYRLLPNRKDFISIQPAQLSNSLIVSWWHRSNSCYDIALRRHSMPDVARVCTLNLYGIMTQYRTIKRQVKQPVFSQYHPNGPCRSCFLNSSNYYTHFESWSIEEKHLITQHLGSTPPPSSCICQAYQKEAKRNHSKLDHTPKWKKLTGEVKEKSGIHNAQQPVQKWNWLHLSLKQLTTFNQLCM